MQSSEGQRLRAFMQQRRLSQTALAQVAGVSQATVSRALGRGGLRHGAARSKLFTHAGISEWKAPGSRGEGRELVLEAFERVWDHSEAHAVAVARVIDALADLRPVPGGEKGST
jgi:transcriptional regulator with XRE-family HTH domain